MSDHDRDELTNGLTEQEAKTAVQDLINNWPEAEASTRRTAHRGLYVMATRLGPDGEPETRTVCRERGQYLILDTGGRPILETSVFPLSNT